MPYRNRVPRWGTSSPSAAGRLDGQPRGVLHSGHDIVRFHGRRPLITCALQFKGRHAEQWLLAAHLAVLPR